MKQYQEIMLIFGFVLLVSVLIVGCVTAISDSQPQVKEASKPTSYTMVRCPACNFLDISMTAVFDYNWKHTTMYYHCNNCGASWNEVV